MSELINRIIGYIENKDYKKIIMLAAAIFCLIAPSFSLIFVFNRPMFVTLDSLKLVLLVIVSNAILFIGCYMIATMRLSIRNDHTLHKSVEDEKEIIALKEEYEKVNKRKDSVKRDSQLAALDTKLGILLEKGALKTRRINEATQDNYITGGFLVFIFTGYIWSVYISYLINSKPYSLNNLLEVIYINLIIYLSFMVGNLFQKRKMKLHFHTKLLFLMGLLIIVFSVLNLYELLQS